MKKEKQIKRYHLQLNNQYGITLIALVVTIVVLLILAGISITALFGENGLINKAKVAGEKTNEAIQNDIAAIQEYDQQLQDLMNQMEKAKAGEVVEEIKNSENEVIVRKILEGTGKTVPVPEGFYYVGGTINTGVVISDSELDRNKYKGQEDVGTELSGNQFVWVPVNGTTLTYAQDHTYDSKHQYNYTDYTDWTDPGANSASVAKYGGYYIGRYEAGWQTDGTTYETSSTKNTTTRTPILKAGVSSWNNINQTNAKTVSENMYSTSKTVTSSLIDSYAWDTTCKWLKQTGKITETAEGKINSTSYGNYTNSNFTVNNAKYAGHIYVKNKSTGAQVKWIQASSYSTGQVTLKGYEITNASELPLDADTNTYRYYKYVEIATGSTEETKLNNIYDMAGNMWEWTTEAGNHRKSDGTSSSNTYAVFRGGGFSYSGSDGAVVCRYGDQTTELRFVGLGFRPVLYIK